MISTQNFDRHSYILIAESYWSAINKGIAECHLVVHALRAQHPYEIGEGWKEV